PREDPRDPAALARDRAQAERIVACGDDGRRRGRPRPARLPALSGPREGAHPGTDPRCRSRVLAQGAVREVHAPAGGAGQACAGQTVMATPEDFSSIDLRVGTVLRADLFPEARKPSIKLEIDFGPELGVRRSSAQLTMHYAPDRLVGRQVIGVVNIGERRIAGFTSQVLVLGAMPSPTEVVLPTPHP